jgi:hypothetical protein
LRILYLPFEDITIGLDNSKLFAISFIFSECMFLSSYLVKTTHTFDLSTSSSQTTTTDGNLAWKIDEYRSYMSRSQGLYNIETYVMKDIILYTLKFFSDPLKVPETLPIAQQIIDSFRIVG